MYGVTPRRPMPPRIPTRARAVSGTPDAPFSPPYSVPSTVNTSTLIGTNSADDLMPSGYGGLSLWRNAVFEAYGGGCYVQWASAAGWYVQSSDSGGHSDNSNVDIVAFDYADATWKFRVNGNDVASTSSPFAAAATNGTPYFEISAATGQMPAPTHAYTTLMPLNEGSQGSVMYVTRGSTTTTPDSSGAAHKQNLNTGVWTRAATGNSAYSGDNHSCAYDSIDNRWYVIPSDIGSRQNLHYLRGSDMTWQVTATYPNAAQPGSGNTPSAMVHEGLRVLLFHRTGALQGLDLNNIAAGWTTLTVSGTPPTSGNRWVWHPTNGCFYCKVDNTGNTLHRLTPPASNPISGTWTFDTITIGGSGLPDRTLLNRHYGGLHYIPVLDLMGWVSGPGQVALIKV
jgi:hypothetical protein